MKKILIISSGYPSDGGQASTAYNLKLFLDENNFETKIIFLRDSETFGDINPKKTRNSFRLTYAKSLLFPYLRRLIKYFFSKKIIKIMGISYLTNKLYKTIMKILVKKELIDFTKKHDFYPDLAITNTPILYENFHQIFDKTLIIIGSAIFFWKLSREGIDYQTISNNPRFLNINEFKKEINGLNKSNLIFNSQLTHDFFSLCGVHSVNKSVNFINFTPHVIANSLSFIDRKYDIGIIISNFNREIKNPKKMDALFSGFPLEKKIAIGKNSNMLNHIPNISSYDLINQEKLAKLLSQTKLIVIPSLYDCSPSILSESILNGCNVLCSKNIGWNELIDDKCVVSNYNNDSEWIDKITLLLKVKIENKKLLKVISNSKKEICKTLNNLIEQE